jgi:SAM-dependent methyltransferase
MRINPSDLEWWLGVAPTLSWTWASSYADSAPHDYVVLGRCPLTRDDFVRAGAVIRTFGQPGKFYRSTNIYLTHGDWKWRTMDAAVSDTDLINRATTDRVYGKQDAPNTWTGEFTVFDAIATEYDRTRNRRWDAKVWQQVVDFFGDHVPKTLDAGCGTGVMLDMGLAHPSTYTGIDPSQGMLNELVLKHPIVHKLIPARFEDVRHHLDSHYELVMALNVPEVALDQLTSLSSELVVWEGRGG